MITLDNVKQKVGMGWDYNPVMIEVIADDNYENDCFDSSDFLEVLYNNYYDDLVEIAKEYDVDVNDTDNFDIYDFAMEYGFYSYINYAVIDYIKSEINKKHITKSHANKVINNTIGKKYFSDSAVESSVRYYNDEYNYNDETGELIPLDEEDYDDGYDSYEYKEMESATASNPYEIKSKDKRYTASLTTEYYNSRFTNNPTWRFDMVIYDNKNSKIDYSEKIISYWNDGYDLASYWDEWKQIAVDKLK